MSPTIRSPLASRSLLSAAFERVRARNGSAGADGMRVTDFEKSREHEIARLSELVASRRYRPYPLLRLRIPKKAGGERWLSIPTVRDRVVQAAAYLRFSRRFEREFESGSHGYRPNRSVLTAINQVKKLRDAGYRWVVDPDIDACFDSIPHDLLLARVARLALDEWTQTMIAMWVRAEVYDGSTLTTLTKGVPQGSVVSPMLANLYLDQLDEGLMARGLSIVRYADDFIILCRTADEASAALLVTGEVLASLRLQLKASKTRTANFVDGFRFLGATFLERGVYLSLDGSAERKAVRVARAPVLDLWRYLELRGQREDGVEKAT